MQCSDEAYFRSCVANERRLAYLLGHHNLEEFDDRAGTLWEGSLALPQWTRSWQACGPLLAEHGFSIHYATDSHHPDHPLIKVGDIVVHSSEHPDMHHALRHAIVKATIHLLERHQHHPSPSV